jgi:hypothetical protein
VRDLALCKVLGMSYAEIRALPLAVYLVALDEVTAQAEKAQEALA